MEKKKKRKGLIITGSILLVVIAVVVVLIVNTGKKELQLKTATIKEERIEITVTATGYVQPVDKVDVGTQVSGVIEKIFVDFNSVVKKGQLLAELDKSTLNEKVTQGKASVASAESDLLYAQQNYDRISQLYEVKAATQSSYEEAVNRLSQAKTTLVNAKASLYQAEVNLGYAEIYSPINGVVLSRDVEEGQTVAASFSTPTLFTIANDLKKMQVEADVDEADIGKVRVGQEVVFTVDAYYNDSFKGEVKQIRLQPVVTNNVVTYTVIVEAPNPEEKLYPGMTASITIVTEAEEKIAVPMSALYFTPNEEVAQKLNIAVPPSHPEQQTVWVKSNGAITPKTIKTGLSDGVYAVVLSGLNQGDEVVLSASYGKVAKKNNQAATTNPLMPSPPKRR